METALARGARVVVQTPDLGSRDALNERLWTYREDSFLAHGGPGDGDAASQPIFLTETDETPNDASLRVLLNPADAPRFAGGRADIVVLFEARDEERLMAARAAWKALAGTGAALSYWREGDEGEWVRAR